MGSGQLNGQPIGPLTALISPDATVPIQGGKAVGQNTYQVSGFFTNGDLQAGFWWREIGVFANDPDNGEILYAYANAGDAGDYIPTVTDQRIEKYIYVSMVLANASSVTVEIPQSDTFIPSSEKGQPGGVAGLDDTGKVPSDQLPDMDFIPNREKGAAGGVAPLGPDGKVPEEHLPEMEYLPLAGGTMAGQIDMDGQKMIGLPEPAGENEAATKRYVDQAARKGGSGMSTFKKLMTGRLI